MDDMTKVDWDNIYTVDNEGSANRWGLYTFNQDNEQGK